MIVKYPCKDCKKRKVGCHQNCTDYQKTREKARAEDLALRKVHNDKIRELNENIGYCLRWWWDK